MTQTLLALACALLAACAASTRDRSAAAVLAAGATSAAPAVLYLGRLRKAAVSQKSSLFNGAADRHIQLSVRRARAVAVSHLAAPRLARPLPCTHLARAHTRAHTRARAQCENVGPDGEHGIPTVSWWKACPTAPMSSSKDDAFPSAVAFGPSGRCGSAGAEEGKAALGDVSMSATDANSWSCGASRWGSTDNCPAGSPNCFCMPIVPPPNTNVRCWRVARARA